MKTLLMTIAILTSYVSLADSTKCHPPVGKYTDIKSVMNQFVLNDGNPNWGDWCYEVSTAAESKECNTELDKWDQWLECAGLENYK